MDEKYRWALVLGLHGVQVGDLITEQMGQDLFFSSTSTLSAISQKSVCVNIILINIIIAPSIFMGIPVFTSFNFININTDTS